MISGIYGIRLTNNHEYRYVGQSRDIVQRFRQHLWRAQKETKNDLPLYRWMRKRVQAVTYDILEETDDLDFRESFWISALLESGNRLLNLAGTDRFGEHSAFEVLSGDIFGRLTVIEPVIVSGKAKWLCKCSCGKETKVLEYNLKNGNTESCGKCLVGITICSVDSCNKVRYQASRFCVTHHRRYYKYGSVDERELHPKEDLTGQRFGTLVVQEPVLVDKHTEWLCLCDCGKTRIARLWVLKNTKNNTCGDRKVHPVWNSRVDWNAGKVNSNN